MLLSHIVGFLVVTGRNIFLWRICFCHRDERDVPWQSGRGIPPLGFSRGEKARGDYFF
jgi:hypothetical protein